MRDARIIAAKQEIRLASPDSKSQRT